MPFGLNESDVHDVLNVFQARSVFEFLLTFYSYEYPGNRAEQGW